MNSLLLDNLLSPIVLAFALGLGAKLLRSDLKVPDPVYQVLSLYLLLAIGLKGGLELREARLSEVWVPIMVTLGVGFTAPFAVMAGATKFLKVSREDAASLAAHYGSVSVVTFIAAKAFVENAGLGVAGILTALVVLMEVPGIMVGLALGRGLGNGGVKDAVTDLMRCKGFVLLTGGTIIGLLASDKGVAAVKPFFTTAFPGVLVLFLLELGIMCGGRLAETLRVGWRLPVFGVATSLLLAMAGVLVGTWSGMDAGTAAVFGCMTGSASYIAAPAAVSHALPNANPGLSLGLALGISFPFNLAIGIPLALKFAQWLA